jgi:two-component system cell cycle sensor histidine kinase/response regulator CckA
MDSEAEPNGVSLQKWDPAAGGSAPVGNDMDPLCLFAGGVAHDFNNLLTVINGYCKLILAETPDAARFTTYAREILRAGEKAAKIVEMVLAYAGRQPISEEFFEVNAMLEKMRGVLDNFLGESISLNLRLSGRPNPVYGDRSQLEWALMILFMNSKEAMPEGGDIDLETRFLGEDEPGCAGLRSGIPRFEISIRDSGHGMAKEVLERIFDPYFSTKHRSNSPGQGLGLACTKGIVRRFGGGIIAESSPGAGTVIRIRLPIAAPT